MDKYLEESKTINFSNPEIQKFLDKLAITENSKENAVTIYFAIRDGFIYDPYHLDIREKSLTASNVAQKKRAWCVEKSLLMVACCRALKIPARFGFAVVKNHIGVEKLINYLGRTEIVFHGYVEVFLQNKWVKCTPAFDKNVCRLSKVSPLNWDGENDSMFQAFSNDQKYMEYLHFYGDFSEIPFSLMHSEMKKYYPHLFRENIVAKEFSFHFE